MEIQFQQLLTPTWTHNMTIMSPYHLCCFKASLKRATTMICAAIQRRKLQRGSFPLMQLHRVLLPGANHYNEGIKQRSGIDS